MHNNNFLNDIKDDRAIRRENKKRPRMKVHGKNLKKLGTRAVKHIAKIEREHKSK